MTNEKIKEIAMMYGIEINNVEAGQGGLFHLDSTGTKIEISDIFDSDDYVTSKLEDISLQKCNTYSTYLASLSLDAA